MTNKTGAYNPKRQLHTALETITPKAKNHTGQPRNEKKQTPKKEELRSFRTIRSTNNPTDKNQSGSRRLELRSCDEATDEQSELKEPLPPRIHQSNTEVEIFQINKNSKKK